MPRKRRVAVANYPHHIVQRGHNRRVVFVTERDRLPYLETLREFRAELGLKIYGWVRALIAQMSPAAWRHILLKGHYTFQNDGKLIDLDALVSELELG